MDRTRDHHAEQDKPTSERQIYVFIDTWNLDLNNNNNNVT
jgi:hypothetical protein